MGFGEVGAIGDHTPYEYDHSHHAHKHEGQQACTCTDIPEQLIDFVLEYTSNLEDNTQPQQDGDRGSSVSTPSPPSEVDSTMNQLIESLFLSVPAFSAPVTPTVSHEDSGQTYIHTHQSSSMIFSQNQWNLPKVLQPQPPPQFVTGGSPLIFGLGGSSLSAQNWVHPPLIQQPEPIPGPSSQFQTVAGGSSLRRYLPRKPRPFFDPKDSPKHITVNGIQIPRDVWAKAFMQIETGRDGSGIEDIIKCGKVLFNNLFTPEEVASSTVSGRKNTNVLCPKKIKTIELILKWMKVHRRDGQDPYSFKEEDIEKIAPFIKEDWDKIYTKVFVERRNDLKRMMGKTGAATPQPSTSGGEPPVRRRRTVSSEIINILAVMAPDVTTPPPSEQQ